MFLTTCYLLWSCCLLWSLIVISGVSLSFLESHCLFWNLVVFPGATVFSGVSLSSLGPHCLPWGLVIFPGALLSSLEFLLLSWSVPLPELLSIYYSSSSSEFLVLRIYVFQHMFVLMLHL